MSGDTLRFNYVFASEEYPTYAPPNENINDVFGFFISGPNINGSFTNNAENIALLPDGVTPISINTINAVTNVDYFIDNGDGDSPPQNTDSTVVQYNGFTVPLTAKINVIPCEIYHLKLAIADASDDLLNSAVFFENGSFASAQLEYGTSFKDIFEGCTEGTITFARKDTTTNQDSVRMNFTIGGTALNGVDYGLLLDDGSVVDFPDHVVLEPFVNEKTLTLVGIDDQINEPVETIVLYIDIEGCNKEAITLDSITIKLHDFIFLNVFPDTLVCPGEEINFSVYFDVSPESVSEFNVFNRPYPFEFLLNNSFYDVSEGVYKSDSSFTFSSINDTSVYISIVDTFGCVGADTLRYDVIEPDLTDFTFTYEDPSKPNIIQFINLSQFNEDTKYIWDFGDSSGTKSLQKEPLYIFPDIGNYYVSLTALNNNTNAECPMIKEIIIKPLEVPNIITPNDDGVNDFFEAYGMYDYHLIIFNRWGKKVFEDENYKNTFNAAGLSDGTYYYLIDYPEKRFSFKGWFQVVR